MESNDTKQSLLSGLVDPTSPKSKENASKTRRYRHCKSAPLADILPAEIGLNSLPRFESLFGKPHPHYLRLAAYLSVYLSAGTVCFYSMQSQIKGKKTNGIVDSVYFCIVTMTTVGYGDLVPDSVLSKLLACAFVFVGMAVGGLILSKAADYLVEKQEILLIKALHIRHKLGPMDMLKEVEINGVRLLGLMYTYHAGRNTLKRGNQKVTTDGDRCHPSRLQGLQNQQSTAGHRQQLQKRLKEWSQMTAGETVKGI